MKLIHLDELRPAQYNPRRADPVRLEWVALSLRKLGWLLPVYATADGEILSGHQRTLVAETMLGWTHAPVEIVSESDGNIHKAINILFNRATNDMSLNTDTRDLKVTLKKRLDELSLELPDVDEANRYPCMNADVRLIRPYLETNTSDFDAYSRNVTRALAGHNIRMPIIVDPDKVVVNGIGRLQYTAERGDDKAEFVTIDASKAEFARLMLNYLSMDFDIHERYADLLRHNSFRRGRRARHNLGVGFTFAVNPGKPANQFDYKNPAEMERWKRVHGSRILDFGAGHLHETQMLRDAGIDVTPFEPYRLGVNESINKAESLHLTEEFLEAVANGKKWSSIFISSVLNSVPFEEDRRHIVNICAALCTRATTVFAAATSEQESTLKALTRENVHQRQMKTMKFKIDYEPNVMLGDFSEKPKVQKYHTPDEFYTLFKSRFELVMVKRHAAAVVAIANKARPKNLRESLEFEFDLPYPDGTRMGMVDKAIEAFEKRLGGKLP